MIRVRSCVFHVLVIILSNFGHAAIIRADGDAVFEAYRADEPSGFFYALHPAELIADDIFPTTYLEGLCDLAGYTPAMAGLGGPYSFAFAVWTNDPVSNVPIAPVVGTECGTDVPCSFDPPITIATPGFWISYDLLEGEDAGPLLAGDYPSIGFSEDCFAFITDDPNCDPFGCGCLWFFGGCPIDDTGNPCGTFHNSVWCQGTEPVGACCDTTDPEEQHCIDDVFVSQCVGRIATGATCAEEPFDPSCGTAACCLLVGGCENLTENQCGGSNGIWQPGEFCSEGDQLCTQSCTGKGGLCEVCNFFPGCDDPDCCAMLCEFDPFCCTVGPDETCCDEASAICSGCPPGEVAFVDPPNGLVDARMPIPPTDHQFFQVNAPLGGQASCWSVCDSASGDIPIVNFGNPGDGTYVIILATPIATNAVTELSYTDDNGASTIGRFVVHPANVNADSTANAIDVLRLVDCLNNVNVPANCPWGLYSQDINRSGMFTPADILVLIDLLNGAGEFDPWNGTSLPSGTCLP